MIGQAHGWRDADEERGDQILRTFLTYRDNGGGRVAVDETGKQREIAVDAAGNGLEGLPVRQGNVGVGRHGQNSWFVGGMPRGQPSRLHYAEALTSSA